MTSLTMRRIILGEPGASEDLARLRAELSAQGNVVSEKGRELTRRVFGDALSPQQVVERVCEDVQRRGLAALIEYTEHFDKVRLTAETLRVSESEIRIANTASDLAFLETVRRVRANVLSFQLGLVHRDAEMNVSGSHRLQLRYRPLRRVGVMIPGGAAAYPSTLLMTVCPALAAGVKEIAVVMPPTANGAYNRDLLAVCKELGVTEVYRVGGAQAVAALAYGVEGIPPVDMIVGPGNLFVALAKKHVFGQVAIDCIAGPSEIIVVADETAPAKYVAADLIAQAEHAPGSSILVTAHAPLLDETHRAMEEQLRVLPRADLARESLQSFGALVLARNEDEIIQLVNELAPEHLHLATRDPERLVGRIDNAGAIFLGHYSPVALGDYVAGPSHVLPTGGTARFASGLSANDFQRRTSVIAYTRQGMTQAARDVRMLAHKEGLTAHAASVDVRLKGGDNGMEQE
jgi:histidinol dehydrogenase